MFGASRKDRRNREGVRSSNSSKRCLRFEGLEQRLLMTHPGVVGFGFTAPYDVTTVEGVRVQGDANFEAEFTFLNAGDFSQISLGFNSIAGTGVVSENFEGAPISGTVDVNVENVDYNLAPNATGVVGVDATATGTFEADITQPPPDPPITSTGDFVANFIGDVNLVDKSVVGTLDLDIKTDDGEIDQSFSLPINTTATLTPSDFAIPDAALASISGLAFLDVNGDGQRDEANEPRFRRAGVVVELRDAPGGGVQGTTTVDRFGGYSFVDVAAGDYTVNFLSLPKGNKATTPNVGDDATDSDVVTGNSATASITLAVGQNDLNVDLGVVPGSAHQNIFERLDADDANGFRLDDIFKMIDHVRTNGLGVFGTLPATKDPADLFLDIDGNGQFNVGDIFDAIDEARHRFFADSGNDSGAGEGESGAGILALDDDLVETVARRR